jgi:signal transduction histidine kinase
VIGLFILLGLVGYAHIKKSEQRHIWVGMAKETAHQLGTPISSLMGWLEVMRSGKTRDRSFIYKEMERDLHRLQRVSTRFSQIGSRPDLKDSDITGILKEVVEYIQRRAPQTGRKVSIREDYQPVPPVALNRDLFQWAAENILKNSLDAMDKEEGRIVVALKTEKEGRCVSIQFRDNGRGMDKEQRRHLFRPGYSTKRRGWGLGLTLARRIIRDYHGGKLQVQESRPGEGTVMRIELYC